MRTRLQQEVIALVGGRPIPDVADECSIDPQVLRDIISGKVRCPTERRLQAVARTLGWTTDQVINASRSEPVAAS